MGKKLLTIVLVAAGCLGAKEHLNVVLIMADDVGRECFSSYGSKQYSTPRIDTLADRGVRFTQAHSKPLCTPSRVAIMTGNSNARNYVDFTVMAPGQYTIADLFRGAGYQTAIAGKWQLHSNERTVGVPPYKSGFHSYLLWNTPITERNRFWEPSLDHNGRIMPVTENDYGPDLFADFVIDFMEQNRDEDFFVYYPMALVHSPFLPTPDSPDRNLKDPQKNFEDMVNYMDKTVGRLSDKIESLGLQDDTLMIFTGDNGTHRSLTSTLNGVTIPGGKGKTIDYGTHVPLVVWGAGVKGGRVVDDLVDHTDILPTIAEMAGLKLPENEIFDGRTYAPQLRGEPGDPREWIFCYYFPRPYNEKFGPPGNQAEMRFVWDKRYKLYDDGRMFDVVADVEEKSPLAMESAPEARGKLRAALDSMPKRGELIKR